MTTTPDTLAKLAPKLSDKLVTLLKCLPEAPFKEHLKSEIDALAAQAQFTGIAARKLADLQGQGYLINGYSLIHKEKLARGFIDSGGFVGWWSNRDHEQAAQATAGWVPTEQFIADLAMAIDTIDESAKSLRDGHTVGGRWVSLSPIDVEVKAIYEEEAALVNRLREVATALPQPQPQSAQSKGDAA